jgi:hypothetical protein
MVVDGGQICRAKAVTIRRQGALDLIPREDSDEPEEDEEDWDDDPLDPLAEVGEPPEFDEEETLPEWGDFWPEPDDDDM